MSQEESKEQLEINALKTQVHDLTIKLGEAQAEEKAALEREAVAMNKLRELQTLRRDHNRAKARRMARKMAQGQA